LGASRQPRREEGGVDGRHCLWCDRDKQDVWVWVAGALRLSEPLRGSVDGKCNSKGVRGEKGWGTAQPNKTELPATDPFECVDAK